jgi:hypothetical protein
MTCKATIRMICEFLEGRLSAPVALAMRKHIDGCTNCRVVLEAAQRTLEVYFDHDKCEIDKAQVA